MAEPSHEDRVGIYSSHVPGYDLAGSEALQVVVTGRRWDEEGRLFVDIPGGQVMGQIVGAAEIFAVATGTHAMLNALGQRLAGFRAECDSINSPVAEPTRAFLIAARLESS